MLCQAYTYVSDIKEGIDNFVKGLHILGETIEDHPLGILFKEL